MKDRFKVDGKAGNLGNTISFVKEESKIVVNSTVAFPKDYLKFLSKKFIRKHGFQDWVRVVASAKDSYALRYFSVNKKKAEAEAA